MNAVEERLEGVETSGKSHLIVSGYVIGFDWFWN
jgi:hypothetical protein